MIGMEKEREIEGGTQSEGNPKSGEPSIELWDGKSSEEIFKLFFKEINFQREIIIKNDKKS